MNPHCRIGRVRLKAHPTVRVIVGPQRGNPLHDKLRRSTERAYLLFNGSREAWVPRSMVEDNGDGTWTMPRWLAEETGLV